MLYAFEDFEVDSDQLELRRGGEVRPIEPQVFSLLELLVSNAHRVVSKEEINEKVWGGRIVSEAALSSRIRSVRLAIGDDGKAQRLVKTVRDRGFRFAGEVETVGSMPAASLGVIENLTPSDGTVDPAAWEVPQASIAVLPLEPLVDDPLKTPLADAISHELITELSRLRWLHVIARGSSFRFRGHDVDLPEVGRILGVRYVVSGSLSIFGEACTVTLELCRPETRSVLWADRIETSLDELMSLRVTLCSRIANHIEGRIQTDEGQRAASLETHHLDSWSAYFRGLWHVNRFNAHDNEIAGHLFERAIELDPGFARAHAGLSFAHFQNAFIGHTRDRGEQVRLAREHASRGYELEPTDPFINLSMGRSDMLRGDWESASVWFDRTTELNSNYSLAFYHRALSNAVTGDGVEGPNLAMRAISLSPIDPLRHAMLATRAMAHLNQDEVDDACEWSDRAARVPNSHLLIWMIAALCNEIGGRSDVARAWSERAIALDDRANKERFLRAFPFARPDFRARVERTLTNLGF